MADHQLEFQQNNEILNRNFNWLNTNFRGFVIELNVHHHRNNRELLRFLDDSIILDGNVSLYRGFMQRLDDPILILEGHHHQSLEVGLSNTVSAAVQRLKEEMVEVSTDCSICLESVGVGEIVARMPCSHLFHTTRITRWLHRKPSCPLCRAPTC
ncbi:hypothetical protein Q3G72_029313 [Acer saccharum]|nr:hypothetical protein Q3G72_029313 [Acer saccharum]